MAVCTLWVSVLLSDWRWYQKFILLYLNVMFELNWQHKDLVPVIFLFMVFVKLLLLFFMIIFHLKLFSLVDVQAIAPWCLTSAASPLAVCWGCWAWTGGCDSLPGGGRVYAGCRGDADVVDLLLSWGVSVGHGSVLHLSLFSATWTLVDDTTPLATGLIVREQLCVVRRALCCVVRRLGGCFTFTFHAKTHKCFF